MAAVLEGANARSSRHNLPQLEVVGAILAGLRLRVGTTRGT
jgi:hypothetical protein